MNKEEIIKSDLSKFELKDNGLYCNEERISYIMPKVEKVEQYYDVGSGKSRCFYQIIGILPNGDKTKSVKLNSLEKLSIFERFGFPDINVSGKEQKLIKEKLQLEASLMIFEKWLYCHQGLQIFEGKAIYALGNRIVGNEQLKRKIKTDFPYNMPDINETDAQNLVRKTDSPINLMTGVSEIIFYYSLQAVVKPILHQIGIESNYTLAVIGPSGHLKTSMVKKMALWIQDKDKQQVNFSSSKRTAKILESMDMFSGMNYLIDDFHAYTRTQDIDQQNKRLDDIVRHVEEKPECANIIVTGEDIQGIYSCIDRMLIIHIPRIKSSFLAELKTKLYGIDDTYMFSVAYNFIKELLNNFEAVKEDCRNYYEKTVSDSENATRTKRHCDILKLTELLYRKYLCEGSEELSCRKALEEALDKQYAIQQEQLQRLSLHEQQDYVEEVMNMLESHNKFLRVETDPDKYTDFRTSCCQKGDSIYITREALCYGMMGYYQRRVNINKIVRVLEDEEILQRDADALTKKFKGKRHYVIYLPFVRMYRGVQETLLQ